MNTTPTPHPMRIRADLSQRAVVLPQDHHWVPSPQPGVERMMLDRDGAETGRATSLVRYAPGSAFPQHRHGGGEEILVLEGTFSEDGRHHGAGKYLRSPPGSSHAPSSAPGALIFVKLWQMPADEAAPVRIDTFDPANWMREDGREVCLLFASPGERVTMERLDAGQAVLAAPVQGAEMLVLAGELHEGGQAYAGGSWIRLPSHEADGRIVAGPQGATVYLKTGHLGQAGQRG